jgi:hypothetical protein
MADLNKVRVQVLDPATGSVIENVDVKTSDAAVYLPDGTTLRQWISNSDVTFTDIQKTIAEHLAVKHVDEEKVDTLLTGVSYDRATGKFTITNHAGQTEEIDTLLEKLPVKFELVDGTGIDGYTEADKLLKVTLDDNTVQYAKLSDLIDIYTGAANTEISVDVTDNEITATLVDGGITNAKIADGTIARAKIDAAFEQQIAAIEANLGDESVPDQIDAKINALDATVTQEAGADGLAISITETDGKLASVTASIAAETYDAFGAAKAVQGETTETVKSVDDKVAALTESSKVTVEKLATATTGYIASYVVKQNGAQVGATIDIPKDYLVKSAELKTAASDIKSGENVVVPSGHKYIDFVVNTVEGSGNESHIYLDVNTLIDVYTGGANSEISVAVSNNEITATLVDGGISYAKLDDALKAKVDAEYVLEAATAEKLGGVKIGDGIAVADDGTISTENVTRDGAATNLNFVSDDATVVIAVTGPAKSLVSTAIGTQVAAQTVTATKTGDKAASATLAYQWYKKGEADTAFAAIAGATSDTLPASSINVASAGTTVYYCVVSAAGEGVVADPVASKKVTVVVA